jgi:hypothetical protein
VKSLRLLNFRNCLIMLHCRDPVTSGFLRACTFVACSGGGVFPQFQSKKLPNKGVDASFGIGDGTALIIGW